MLVIWMRFMYGWVVNSFESWMKSEWMELYDLTSFSFANKIQIVKRFIYGEWRYAQNATRSSLSGQEKALGEVLIILIMNSESLLRAAVRVNDIYLASSKLRVNDTILLNASAVKVPIE